MQAYALVMEYYCKTREAALAMAKDVQESYGGIIYDEENQFGVPHPSGYEPGILALPFVAVGFGQKRPGFPFGDYYHEIYYLYPPKY